MGVGVRPMLLTPLQEKSANVAAMASITERAEHEPKSVSSSRDGLARKKNATTIDPEKADWKMLDSLGLSRERLGESGELEKVLNWQKRM